MTPSGSTLRASIDGMRAFHRQCKLLLEAAESHLTGPPTGWRPAAGGEACMETSYSWADTDKWMPDTLFRWYTLPQQPLTFAWVSIVLYDRRQHLSLEEPLLSAGFVRYGAPKTGLPHKWRARSILWATVPRDGTWHRSTWPTDDAAHGKDGAIEVQVMGRPLVEITDNTALATRLLEPLVAAVERAGFSPEPGEILA